MEPADRDWVALLASVVERSSDFIGISDLELSPLYLNPAGRQMVGLDPDDDLSALSVLDFFWPEDLAKVRAEALPALERTGSWRGQVRFRHFGTGAPLHTFWNVVTLLDGSGEPVGYATISPDLGPLKQTEDALRRKTRELELVDERKDQFLAVLGHELRNPLAALANAVALLRGGPLATRDREHTYAMMDRQVGRLTGLLNEMLDLTRIHRGKVELVREPLPFGIALAGALETSRPAIDEKRHHLTVENRADDVWLFADRARLEQVLVNLIGNATKYTAPGGKVSVCAERAENELEVIVADSGVGVAPANLEAIFDPFFQVESGAGGLGIGLALARELVALHGGTLCAESAGLGKGTAFRLRLPILVEAELPAGASAPREHSAAPDGSGLRVLAVDDEEDGVRGLAQLLERFGCEVEVALSGGEALAVCRRSSPDLVILDLGLPDMSGHDVARALRRDGLASDAVLVALTGYGHREARRRAREAGFDAHLLKPIDAEALGAVLRAARERCAGDPTE